MYIHQQVALLFKVKQTEGGTNYTLSTLVEWKACLASHRKDQHLLKSQNPFGLIPWQFLTLTGAATGSQKAFHTFGKGHVPSHTSMHVPYLFGSLLNIWYCPRRRSPAASWRKRCRSTTYSALMWYLREPRCPFQ